MEDSSKIVTGLVPVPFMAEGFIVAIDDGRRRFDVQITRSEAGNFNGPIPAQAIASPGTMENYRIGDRVVVHMYAAYNLRTEKIDSPILSMPVYVLGTFNMPALVTVVPETADTAGTNGLRYFGRKTRAGLLCHDDGTTEVVTEGLPKSMWCGSGDGVLDQCMIDQAQNFHRQIIGMDANVAKEHFGLYEGVDDNERSTQLAGKRPVVYRRFVPKNDGMDGFVSTCEGARAPFIGANNDDISVDGTSDVVYYKAMQSGLCRVTSEAGESGQGFFKLRVDKVVTGEKQMPMTDKASPAFLGNLFSAMIGDDGSVEIRAAGKGLNAGNSHGFMAKIDKDGNATVYSAGKILLSHSESDVETNSICLDPDEGIVLKSDKKLTFNGEELVTKRLVDFIDANQAALCQVTSIGGPAPLHPKALAEFMAKKDLPASQGGYTTKGTTAIPLVKKIMDLLLGLFSSV